MREETIRCPTCAPKPGEVNHPNGMIFIGWGRGWEVCGDCGGTTRIAKSVPTLSENVPASIVIVDRKAGGVDHYVYSLSRYGIAWRDEGGRLCGIPDRLQAHDAAARGIDSRHVFSSEVPPDVEHLRKRVEMAEAQSSVAALIEEAQDRGRGGSGTDGRTDNELFIALAAVLSARDQERNPCKSCGADPSVYPEPGAELPIVRGALDAQEKSEQRLFAERERSTAAVVSAHGHGQESALRDAIAFLAGSGHAEAANKLRTEFAGTLRANESDPAKPQPENT